MQNVNEVESLFRKLHEERVLEYEDRCRRQSQNAQRVSQHRRDRASKANDIFPDLRPNAAALAAASEREKHLLAERLEKIHSDLGNRQRADTRDGLRTSILTSNSRQLSVPIFAVGLMAEDHSQFEGLAGERGNPWILPSNPAEVNLKVREVGSGDHLFFSEEPTIGPVTAYVDLWFVFWPDTSAFWNLTAIVDLFGYYYLRANDSWYDSKWTRANVTARFGVYQYFWSGVKSLTLLDRDEGNIDEGQIFDNGGWFDTGAVLRAGDAALFLVQIELTAHCQGNGSYSEVNFSDGAANYIKPLILLASPA